MLLEHKDAPGTIDLEFPGRPLPAQSPLYVGRSPLEEMACQELLKPGSVIRIQAPQRMGKSSFMNVLLDRAQQQGYRIACIDFQEADESIFTTLERTLRWFCANVGRRLGLPSQLDDYWDEDIGAKVSCTIYFEDYLIEAADTPLVLALNEVNRIFEHPDIAKDFLPLLRFWHEQSKQSDAFGRLRMILTHSTEIYVPLQVHQSPFNVGCPIQLADFTLAQTQDLARRYGLEDLASSSGESALQALLNFVGGSPYRLSLAFYHCRTGNTSLDSILTDRLEHHSIYNAHLQSMAIALQSDPDLKAATLNIMRSADAVELPPPIAYKLHRLGIVALNGHRARMSCQLYRQFLTSQIFRSQLSTPPDSEPSRPLTPTRPDLGFQLFAPSQLGHPSAPTRLDPSEQPAIASVPHHRPPTETQQTEHPLLGNRYRLQSRLGRGGFGTTYLALDTHRPGEPTCVVKKLERWFEAAELAHARRLFATEAQTLEALGSHDCIPRLFAYFEEAGEFYLVQEFIKGTLLSDEMASAGFFSDADIIHFLKEMLPIVTFVHEHQTIHRDIKPDNIIRREADGKLVLIDFGSTKRRSILQDDRNERRTICVGTQGYSPWEQNQGQPQFNSDLYALGAIAIEMATGRLTSTLECDDHMELKWHGFARHLNPWLVAVINGMVHHNYKERYQTAREVLQELTEIGNHG